MREWSADRDPVGIGTKFRIRARLGLLPIRGVSEAVEWDPPSLPAFRSVRPTWPFRMTASHRFESRADGDTDYTWTIDFHEVSVIGRPLIALASQLFQKAQADQAQALYDYLSKERS